METTKICVLGLGYVGLTLSTVLADVGYSVVCVDKDSTLINNLKKGKPQFYEKGLEEPLSSVNNSNTAPIYTNKLDNDSADTYIITVGTPILKPSLDPNLDYVRNATKEVAKVLKKGDIVILRSTVPVGTTRKVVIPTLEKLSGLIAGADFDVAFCPERTIEGKALKELRELPQIIGSLTQRGAESARGIFNNVTATIIDLGSIEASEMLKIMDNTFRDLCFAYSNQISLICNKLNIDMTSIVRAANDGYNRNNIPVPSPGVGGACLSKDPYILASVCENIGIDQSLFLRARAINESMPHEVASRTLNALKEALPDKKIYKVFILGFAFKGIPETSDMRESPTLELVASLRDSKAKLLGHDPNVSDIEVRSTGATPTTVEEGFALADAAILMTNHQLYQDLNISELCASRNQKIIIFDGWGMVGTSHIKNSQKIVYLSI